MYAGRFGYCQRRFGDCIPDAAGTPFCIVAFRFEAVIFQTLGSANGNPTR